MRKLYTDLHRLGIEAWYDREHMTADGSPFTQAIGDAIRGRVWDALGDPHKALDYYEQALSMYRAVGDRAGEAVTLFNMSFLTDDLDQAIQMAQKAYDLLAAIGSPYAESHIAPRLRQLRGESSV